MTISVTTNTTSSATSVNGVASGIDTTALINAIMAQKGTGVARLKAQQTLNTQKTAALATMKTELGALTISMAALQDTFNSRTVTNSDSNNTYATATASGSASGSYDLTVNTVATKGRLSAGLTVADPSVSPVYGGTPAIFAVQGTDGTVYQIPLDTTTNTLNGLRDQINKVAGVSVTASVVKVSTGNYQLVITANSTGTGGITGTNKGVVTIADITSNDGLTFANNLGIGAATVDDLAAPTQLTSSGGLHSTGSAIATDANFTLNGVSLTRSTNVIKDAVDGMTFTLKQGGQQGTSTLTVAQNIAGTTTALQDYITKYNQLMKDYKTASTSSKNADGSIAQAPLSNDPATRSLMTNLKGTLAGATAGLAVGSAYKTWANLGVTNLADGSLYLNTYTFQQAMNADPSAVAKLFSSGGAGQAASDLISAFTGTTGGMATLLKSINTQNTNLTSQIAHGQAILDQQKATLQDQFAQMEAVVGSMKAVAGTLLGS